MIPALLVKPATPSNLSRNVSATSFTASGQIVVAPAETINFVTSTQSVKLNDEHNKSAKDGVEKEISGTENQQNEGGLEDNNKDKIEDRSEANEQ